jgi:hypothetical protein
MSDGPGLPHDAERRKAEREKEKAQADDGQQERLDKEDEENV